MTINEIEVRSLCPEHARVFAELHRDVFPYYPSSHLGLRLCEKLYLAYSIENEAIGFGAWHERSLLGLVIGCPEHIQQEINRKLRIAAMKAVLVRPWLWGDQIIRARIRRGSGRATSNLTHASCDHDRAARVIKLVNIGVSAEARGFGVGGAMLRAFVDESAKRGFTRAELVVGAKNAVALRFYQLHGWERVSGTVNSETSHYIYSICLSGRSSPD